MTSRRPEGVARGPLALMPTRLRTDHGWVNTDHHALEVLSEEECVGLLRSRSVGRIALSAGSLPVVLPVKYVVDGSRILMRTGPDTRLAAATSDAVVAFEVDEFDDELETGWSVTVQGLAREVSGTARLAADHEAVLATWLGPLTSRHFSIPTEIIFGQRLHPLSGRRLGSGPSVLPSGWVDDAVRPHRSSPHG